jgi:hypothetical protein
LKRHALALLARAILRAAALALAALLASEVESGYRLAFLATWTALFLLPALALSALELPLRAGLNSRTNVHSLIVNGAVGVFWGVLLVRFVPLVRALGWAAPVALAIASLPLSRGAAKPARPRLAAAGGALLLAVALAAWIADPEAHYAERYEEPQAEVALGPPGPQPDLARAIAHSWMRAHPPDGLRWSWEEAVAVEGLLAYAGRSGDEAPYDYGRKWIDARADEALSCRLWADAAAPASCVLLVTAKRPAAVDERIIERVRVYLRERAPRLRSGAPSHLGEAALGLLPPAAWVDSMFMHGMYLQRLFRLRGDAGALEEARRLALAMASDLRDPATGAYRHAGIEIGPLTLRLPVEPYFWERGNGWAAYVLADHQAVRAERGLAPDPEIQALLEPLLASLDPVREDLETAARALWIAALARAGRPPARAADLLRERVSWHGGAPVVERTTIGTHPGFRAYYRAVPERADVGHGVGAVLLALSLVGL